MPELPEVETIRRDLAPELEGSVIRDVRILQADIVMPPPGPARFRREVAGSRIRAVDRRGKYLLLRLEREGAERVLQVQLRMTGRFALGRAPPDADEYRHIAARFHLDDGRTLHYDDVRRLGGFRLLRPEAWEEAEARLGPEPLAPGFTPRRLARALEASRAPVKNALLDQRRVAGVGNIYASEALHRAALDPRRAAGELQPEEVARLHGAIVEVLTEALAEAGTTFADYRAVNGRSGGFQRFLRVYAREGEPCPRCGGRIRRTVQAGRSTYHCPACQR